MMYQWLSFELYDELLKLFEFYFLGTLWLDHGCYCQANWTEK